MKTRNAGDLWRHARGFKVAFQPRLSRFTGVGKGIERDFQSPKQSVEVALNGWFKSPAGNQRNQLTLRSKCRARINPALSVDANQRRRAVSCLSPPRQVSETFWRSVLRGTAR